MATLTQALALKKENPNLSTRDAIAQIEGNTGTTPTIQNLPVQSTGGATIPIAPQVTPTPAPTTPVAPATPPVPMAQAPVSPQTGISTPQAPITPPTPVTPTATPEQKTVDKTTEIQAKNEAQMALNKQKSELAIADRKKQAEEAKIASIPTDQKSIVQSLISGVSVPPQNTPEYRNAQTIATQYKRYNSMTDTELLSNLRQGNIGSELDSYLQSNPNYAAAKQKLAQQQKIDSLNRVGQSIMNVSTGGEPVDLADLTSIEAKYTAPIGTNQQAYLDYVTNNQDVKTTGLELKRIATQISETSTTYNAALKDLQKTYQGKLSASALLTLMGSRTRDTKDLIDSLVNAKTLAQGDFDLAMKIAEGEYGAVTKDLAVQQELAQEARQQQYARENAVFQANLGLQTSQAEFDQKIAQQAQAAKDPISGTNAIIDTFEKMGIMADRSRQEIIADVQNKVASGIPLGQALTELQTAFKSKPMYKAMVEAQMRKLAPPEPETKGFSFANVGDGVIAVQDPNTGEVTFKSAKGGTVGTDANGNPVQVTSTSKTGNALLDTPDNTIIPSRLSAVTNPNGGKECGEYVNDIAGASVFGNSIEQKKSVANETTGGIGKAIVWQPSNSPAFQKYGHVGVIIGEEGDNWLVKSSNLRGDGAVTTDLVPKSASSNYRTLKNLNIEPVRQKTNNLATLGQFMKDNQDRGTGYSNDDVKAFNEKIDRLVKAGDTNGMALAYRNMIMKDKDFKKEFDDTTVFVQALDDVQSMINAYEEAGKSTNALKGMAEKVSRKLGITQDEALAKLQTQLGVTMANYIRSISGTAASDVEVQRLMGNMAQIGNVKNLNTAIVEQVRNNGLSGLKKMIDNRMYGMPEELKPAVFGDIYTKTQSSSPTTSNYNFQSDWENL